VIHCPLIDIRYPDCTDELSYAISNLTRYNWVAFTSVHGVIGFWRCLQRAGLDARALGRCKLAAIGPATAEAIKKRGIHPDVVPQTYDGSHLAEAILKNVECRIANNELTKQRLSLQSPMRVLTPRGNLARGELASTLTEAGMAVDAPVVYHTHPSQPPDYVLDEIEAGVDAVLFCSPSAVRRFVELGLANRILVGGAHHTPFVDSLLAIRHSEFPVVGCIGPTTAEEARKMGIKVDIVPATSDARALVRELFNHFCDAVVTV